MRITVSGRPRLPTDFLNYPKLFLVVKDRRLLHIWVIEGDALRLDITALFNRLQY